MDNKRSRLGMWPIIFLFILIAMWLYQGLNMSREGEYKYSDFVQDVQEKQNEIKEVVIVPNEETPTGAVNVVWKNGDSNRFYVANTESIEQYLSLIHI